MPAELHAKVADAAAVAARSMNAEIVVRLEHSFANAGNEAPTISSRDLRTAVSVMKSAVAGQDVSIRTLAGLLEIVVSKLDDKGDRFARDVKSDIREFARLIKAGETAAAYETAGKRLQQKAKK